MVRSNDNVDLTPRVEFEGPTLEFDFPRVRIGVAEYPEGPTGCTVFHFPKDALLEADIRGGAVGVLGGHYNRVDAVCLAGGSSYGLEAVTGVAAEMLAMNRYSTSWNKLALVSGAVIYDYSPRRNAIYPDKALGRAALRSARPGVFPLGPRGAGCSAVAGKMLRYAGYQGEHTGQGGAFRAVGPTKVAVFTVVNALGAIVGRDGKVARGNRSKATGERVHLVDAGAPTRKRSTHSRTMPRGNTTLTVLITNRKLRRESLRQIAKQVHASMARAIQPFHTALDGDVLFAISTNEVASRDLWPPMLGELAADVAWDAVLASFEQS